MLMARRNLMTSGWRNPYVTDGLVAMWDGEWNAGPGKHDPNATVWKDLVGSNDLSIENRPYAYFVDNHLVVDDRNGIYNTRNPETLIRIKFNEMSDVLADYRATHESVLSYDYNGEGGNGFSFMFGGFCGSVLTVGAYGSNSSMNVCCMFNNSTYGIRYFYINNHGIGGFGKKVCMSCATSSTNNDVHINGVPVTQDATWSDSGTFRNELRFFQLEKKKAISSLYNYRVYSRILTPEERAANYAVDKARFNLPDAA